MPSDATAQQSLPRHLPGRSDLGVLVKPVSADCNLACEYCFYRPKAELYAETKVHRMPDEVLARFVGSYMALAGRNPSFGWQGGEPTLAGLGFFRRVVRLQATLGRPGQVVGNGLQTNGMLLDREWAHFLAEYRFLVGVSLDGPPDLHDHYRRTLGGGPSQERVMEALEHLRAENVEFNILVLVNALNAQQPARVWDWLVDHDLKFLQFIPCVEPDPETGLAADFSVTPEDWGRFLQVTFDRWAARPGLDVYVRDFHDRLAVELGQQQPTCTFRDRCGVYFVVEHNGDIYPCDFFVQADRRLGNLMETPLEELVNSPRFDEFAEQKSRHGPQCRGCRWLPLCHGGCVKDRVALGGPVTAPSYFCKALQGFFQHSRRGFRRLAEEVRGQTSTRPRPRAEVSAGIRRNDPCPCGSGRKYKQCCLR